MTTIRKLIHMTPNMGTFEISAAWLVVPKDLKEHLPPDLVNKLDALSAAVVVYKAAITAYNAAKKALEAQKQVNSAIAYPGGVPTPEPVAVTAIASEEVAKAALSAPKITVVSSKSVIDKLLDTEIPGT